MIKKTLIYDDELKGHHLEYIHHLYMGAASCKDEEFVFVLNPNFENYSSNFSWPESSNITISFLSLEQVNQFESSGMLKSLYLCKSLKREINKHNVTNVLLISLMGFMPFLPLFVNRKVKVSGIVYLIYLYRWQQSKLISRFLDVIKYLLFSKSNVFKNVYLLNDKIAPIYLNRKFKTSVFSYLPDPFVPISINNERNLRLELKIPEDKIICLHFGALAARKGTLEILKAIILGDNVPLNKCCFIFAGELSDDIKDSFYQLMKNAETKTQIIFYDKFCDYDFIGSLCLISDYVIIPYKDPYHSSGVIAYAAQFNTPVVGPPDGLLGKLIKKNRLGVLLENTSVNSLTQFINNIDNLHYTVNTSYVQERTVSHFIDVVFEK